MMRLPLRLLTLGLALIAVAFFYGHAADRFAGPDVYITRAADARETGARNGWGSSVGFADNRRLNEHYEKHGHEFGRITREDYLRAAQALRDAAVGGAILETIRSDGVRTRFDRQTGAFLAVSPNGVIRTFFKPNDGERYFRRQAERN